MATLVFDIETSALPIENFDEVQQEYLFRDANKIPDPVARHARKTELEMQMNLYPFTARVVCIAMLNADSQRGKVLFTAEDNIEEENEAAPIQYVPCIDEGELLGAETLEAPELEAPLDLGVAAPAVEPCHCQLISADRAATDDWM